MKPSEETPARPRRADIGFILLVAVALLAWGSAFSVIRAAGHIYSPGPMALLRFLVASLTLVLLSPYFGVRRPERGDWPILFCLGLSGFVIYHLALNLGEHTITAGSAAFLINTAPIFFLVLARVFLKEVIQVRQVAGMLICLGGVALIASGEGKGLGGVFAPGALLILLAAVSASVYMALQRQLLKRYGPFELTCYAIWTGTLMLLVFAGQLWSEMQHAPARATLGIVYMGVLPGAMAYAVWALIMKRMSATSGVSLLYLVPPLSVLVAWAALGEKPVGQALLGGGVVLAGVAIVNWRR